MKAASPPGAPAVECLGLTVAFGGRAILRDVRLAFGAGTVAALVGPCGAGKTTLLKTLAGLLPPSAGSARICGETVTATAPDTRRRVGFSPAEERSFYWRLSGRENLRFFASLHGIGGRASAPRIGRLLREVGLGERGDLRFQAYSSGMRQALGLARAMLHDPPVLLLDEPTRSLSHDLAERVRRLLVRTAHGGGATVVMATHDLREVEQIADVVAVLEGGTVRAAGSVAEVAAAGGAGSGLAGYFDKPGEGT